MFSIYAAVLASCLAISFWFLLKHLGAAKVWVGTYPDLLRFLFLPNKNV